MNLSQFSSSEGDEPRVCYTEWSKLEREKETKNGTDKPIYRAGRETRTHREQPADTTGEKEGETDWQSSTETYTSPYVKHRASQFFYTCSSILAWKGENSRGKTFLFGHITRMFQNIVQLNSCLWVLPFRKAVFLFQHKTSERVLSGYTWHTEENQKQTDLWIMCQQLRLCCCCCC